MQRGEKELFLDIKSQIVMGGHSENIFWMESSLWVFLHRNIPARFDILSDEKFLPFI